MHFYDMGNFTPFDGWLTFDGLRYTSFFDENGESRDSSGYSCATGGALLFGAYDFGCGMKSLNVQTTFSMRSAIVSFLKTFLLRAARHPVDSDGRPTAGAQVLARVSLIPWYPYFSGPALHWSVPSRSESCFFAVVERD